MDVSISAVVHDLHTTVSGVQAAIALEPLVCAAFILMAATSAICSAASARTCWDCSVTPSARWQWRLPRA